MKTAYPNDADGNALRRIAASRWDMSRPLDVDFQVTAPDENAARLVAEQAARLGYRAEVYGGACAPWTCQCTKSMVASYASVKSAQAELDVIARSTGACTDRWGAYGKNKKYVMSGSEPESARRRWFQYSRRSLIVAMPILAIAMAMLYAAYSSEFSLAVRLVVALTGLLLTGGLAGAAVGYAEDPQYVSMVRQRAISGAILFAGIALICVGGFYVLVLVALGSLRLG